MKDKILVGCEEWCAYPDLGVPAILARVDSGARTSSIHAFNIQPFTRKGKNWVSFEVHPLQKTRGVVVRCEAPVHDHRPVKSSSGVAEKRYVIQTTLRLWEQEILIELTLANRDSMGYRMLLGREAMVGRILVDPELECCLGHVSEATLDHHYRDARRSADGLRIGLLAENANSFSLQRLIEACEERGHFVHFIDVRKCYLTIKDEISDIYERNQGLIPDFDLLIPRFSQKNTAFGAATLGQYGLTGATILQSPEAIRLVRDKPRLFQKLVSFEVPVCPSGFAFDVQDLKSLIDQVGGEPCVVQLFDGLSVKPQMNITSDAEAKTLMKAWRGLDSCVRVMPRNKRAPGTIVRNLVIGNRIIASIKKDQIFKPGSTQSDTAQYENFVPSKEEKKIVAKLVAKVAKITGLNYLSVDLLKDEAGFVINDVHVAPNFEQFEKISNKDIATLLVIAIEKMCDWQVRRKDMSEVTNV